MNDRPVYPGVIDAKFPDAFTKMPPQPRESKPGQLPTEMIRKFFDQFSDASIAWQGGEKDFKMAASSIARTVKPNFERSQTHFGFHNPQATRYLRNGFYGFHLWILTNEHQDYIQGFVVVEHFFSDDELEPCLRAVEEMVDRLATKLYNAGKIDDLCSEYGVFQRLTMLEEKFKGATVLLFKNQKIPQAFMDLWSNERLLNVIEQVLGPDVSGHPVWNLRTKVPKCTLFNIPWHQDNGYFSTESYDHMIATAWIPFLDVMPENGCLQMIRNGHKYGKVARHQCCVGDSWYVQLEEEEMERTLGVNVKEELVSCPISKGGFVLFSNIIPHRSLPNVSNEIRWSIDLRWQSPHEHWGFYNIGEGVPMRSSKDTKMKPDFSKFLSIDRKELWRKLYSKDKSQANDEFDTTLIGPWMGRWDVVHRNRHTNAFNF